MQPGATTVQGLIHKTAHPGARSCGEPFTVLLHLQNCGSVRGERFGLLLEPESRFTLFHVGLEIVHVGLIHRDYSTITMQQCHPELSEVNSGAEKLDRVLDQLY